MTFKRDVRLDPSQVRDRRGEKTATKRVLKGVRRAINARRAEVGTKRRVKRR